MLLSNAPSIRLSIPGISQGLFESLLRKTQSGFGPKSSPKAGMNWVVVELGVGRVQGWQHSVPSGMWNPVISLREAKSPSWSKWLSRD